jgi:hypothetical protein
MNHHHIFSLIQCYKGIKTQNLKYIFTIQRKDEFCKYAYKYVGQTDDDPAGYMIYLR